jgi:hypothetical protein
MTIEFDDVRMMEGIIDFKLIYKLINHLILSNGGLKYFF